LKTTALTDVTKVIWMYTYVTMYNSLLQ
jgi:hypothetical protein